MKFLPITLIVCLSSSLFVAMVISPVQAAVFINIEKERASTKKKNFLRKAVEMFDEKFFGAMVKNYEKALRWCLHRRKLTIGVLVLLLIV
jgi:multidrug efflux pump subunit AcrB